MLQFRGRARLTAAGTAAAVTSAMLVVGSATPASANSVWAATDLGTLGGSYSNPWDINDAGQVTGTSQDDQGRERGFVWTDADGLVDIGTLGGSQSSARGQNASNVVVGEAQNADNHYHAVRWTAGDALLDLGTLGGTSSNALAISDDGTVFGDSDTTGDLQTDAFRWTEQDGMVDLGTLGGTASSIADANANAEAVGSSPLPGDQTVHAFYWSSGTGMVDLGTLGGANSFARSISDTGLVAGVSDTGNGQQHAFAWTLADGMVDVGTLGGSTSGVNWHDAAGDDGQVAGFSMTAASVQHGFAWTADGGIVDVGTLGGSTSAALGVGANGDLLGWAETASGAGHAYTWTSSNGMTDIAANIAGDSQALAENAAGQILGSATISGNLHALVWELVNATAPDSPHSVVAAAGDASAAVSWSPPANDGGSAITSYTVSSSGGEDPVIVAGSETNATFPDLTNGTAYTFTVTATNAVGTSVPSAPSNSVTPTAGNQAAAGYASTDEPTTVSTGADPADSGGATTDVVVPEGTSGGAVTVTQTATSESAPSGYMFGDVQVDITAPTATATNPLVLTFTTAPPSGQPLDQLTLDATQIYRTEGTGTPTAIPLCVTSSTDTSSPTYGDASPDPCVFSKSYVSINAVTYIEVVVLTSSASHWNRALPAALAVSVGDGGYSPRAFTLPLANGVVTWNFQGTRQHSATDAIGLGAARQPLFDSGRKVSGSFSYRFLAAGAYDVRSTAKGDSFTGQIGIPPAATPGSGTPGGHFTVTWARQSIAGYVFDVRVRFRPAGSTVWKPTTTWKKGVTSASGDYTASLGTGTYWFDARVRNTSTGQATGYSPGTTIQVT